MAALTITAANVVKGSGATVQNGTAGAAITAGQPIYKDAGAGNVLKLCDCNAGTAAPANCDGIALHAAATGQPIAYQDAGEITIGATVVAGEVYCVGGTPGTIVPRGDLTTGDRLSVLAFGKNTTTLKLIRHNTEVVFA